jgi:hypothetical protein
MGKELVMVSRKGQERWGRRKSKRERERERTRARRLVRAILAACLLLRRLGCAQGPLGGHEESRTHGPLTWWASDVALTMPRFQEGGFAVV